MEKGVEEGSMGGGKEEEREREKGGEGDREGSRRRGEVGGGKEEDGEQERREGRRRGRTHLTNCGMSLGSTLGEGEQLLYHVHYSV